jgi:hypothetical protein
VYINIQLVLTTYICWLWWKSIFGWKSQQIIKQYDDEIIYVYIHKLSCKIRRVWWKSKTFVRNQVIKYCFKIKRLYNTVIVLNWLFLPSDVLHCDYYSVFTGIGKYQVKKKTDKYILNILEHNHLQNTMFILLRIFIQEQNYISSI